MIGFLGEYEVNLDAKGRFMLPSGFRKQLPEGADKRFIIKRGLYPCINLYTESEWDKIEAKFLKLNDFNPKVQLLKQLMFDGVSTVEPDGTGRVLVPKNLLTHAGMKKEIVFSAKINMVEIWDKDTYYDHLKKHSKDLLSLSNEIFGNDYLDPFSDK